MKKEEVLQKANDYCNEKGYTSETITDDFKDKFSGFFAKKYSEETTIDDEGVYDDLKFNLDSVFSATSNWAKSKQVEFEEKENDYKSQIEELNKKVGKVKTIKEPVIPKEVQEQLDELKKFKNEEAKKSKFKDILTIAKRGIRQDLHKSFETFAAGIDVSLEREDKEQAKAMVERFQEIFKDSIGDVKPLAPQQTRKRDEEVLSSLPRLKV